MSNNVDRSNLNNSRSDIGGDNNNYTDNIRTLYARYLHRAHILHKHRLLHRLVSKQIKPEPSPLRTQYYVFPLTPPAMLTRTSDQTSIPLAGAGVEKIPAALQPS